MRVVSEPQSSEQMAALVGTGRSETVLIRIQNKDAAVLMSMERYQRVRDLELKEFERLRHEISEEAKANGLTEEILHEILAEAKADRRR